MPSDREYMLHVAELFEEKGGEVYCVELVASKEVQVYRNEIENRLENKASRRYLEFARKTLADLDRKHRTESREGEIPFKNYTKIDNSELQPDGVYPLCDVLSFCLTDAK